MDRLGGLAPIKWFSLPSGRRKPGFAPRRYRAAPEFLRRVRGGTTTAPTRRSHTTVRRAPRPRREFVSPLRRCLWRAAAQRHLALQRTERVEIEIDPYRPAMVLLVMAARIAFDAQLHEGDAAVAADWQFDGISLFGGRLCNGAELMKLDARQRGGGEALQGPAVVLRPVERRQQAQEIGLELGADFSAARACEFLFQHQARIAQRLPQTGRRQRSGR